MARVRGRPEYQRKIAERKTAREMPLLPPGSIYYGDRIKVIDSTMEEQIIPINEKTHPSILAGTIIEGATCVSSDTPFARAVIGKQVEEKTEVALPGGIIRVQITEVEPDFLAKYLKDHPSLVKELTRGSKNH